MPELVGLLVVVGMLWLLFRLVGHSVLGRQPPVGQPPETWPSRRREQAELHSLRALVSDLRETAWDHRELDSPLATIFLDEIRRHERRMRDLDT